MITFEQPLFAFLFLLLPIIFIVSGKKQKNKNAFVIPIVSAYSYKDNSFWLIKLYAVLIYLIVACLVIVFMHPVLQNVQQIQEYDAHDIIFAIDCSQSMLFADVKPNRFEIAKQTTIDFINKRAHDRIGAIGFAGDCMTIMPLIKEYSYLIEAIKKLNITTTDFNHLNLDNGTAIGVAIATALLRLKESNANTKIIILISDGSNNAGNILPEDAITTAKYMGIKVYTIGIGNKKYYNGINNEANQFEYDVALLENIANETQAEFFQANNKSELNNIYEIIDKLETTKFSENVTINHYSIREHFIYIALFLITVAVILRSRALCYI